MWKWGQNIYLWHLKQNDLMFHSFWFLFIYLFIQKYKPSQNEKSDPRQKECILPLDFSILI